MVLISLILLHNLLILNNPSTALSVQNSVYLLYLLYLWLVSAYFALAEVYHIAGFWVDELDHSPTAKHAL